MTNTSCMVSYCSWHLPVCLLSGESMLYLCKLIVVISINWHLRSCLKISGRKRKFQKLFIDFDNWTLIAYQCLILTSCAINMISLINCCLYLCTVFRRSFILYLLKGKTLMTMPKDILVFYIIIFLSKGKLDKVFQIG